MATLGANMLTLADWAKRQNPEGGIPQIIELLNLTNEILLDMTWMEGNLVTGHRTSVRTGLPTVAWRLLNQGVAPSKSRTAQMDEACGLMEAWSEADVELARLGGAPEEFRFSEAQAFIEAMNQQMATTLFYGNAKTNPEQFTGLSARYSAISGAQNASHVISGGGSGADNTSIWLILWGPNTLSGIFPKGSTAGLGHLDMGEETAETVAGIAGNRMRVYRDQWTWKCGIALRDWRYVVRIPNIDISNLVAQSSDADLIKLMTKATWRIPSFGMGRAAFYVNRTVGEYLDIQAQLAVKTGGQLGYSEVDGQRIMKFRNIPIRTCDALLETEAAVS